MFQQLKDELGEVVAELEALDGQEECKQNSKAKQMSIGRKKFNMDPKKGKFATNIIPFPMSFTCIKVEQTHNVLSLFIMEFLVNNIT